MFLSSCPFLCFRHLWETEFRWGWKLFFFFLCRNDNKTQSSAYFFFKKNLRMLPLKRDKPYDGNLNVSSIFWMEGSTRIEVLMNNFLQPACLNRITVSQLAFPCNEMTSSDVDGIVVQASRNKIKARTTESVNEQINIYAFPLANRYLICNFIIHGAARDCSQQDRRASSFRSALFFCIRLCIFTLPPHNQTSRQPLFCAPCHWYCWGLSSLTDKGPIGTDWALIEAWRTGVSMCSSPFSTQEE